MAKVGRPRKIYPHGTPDEVEQRIKFLKGMGLKAKHIYNNQLDRPMTDLAMLVLANQVLRLCQCRNR